MKLKIEIEALVLGSHTFQALGKDVARVTVIGTAGGPMGQGVQCEPAPVFELDADMGIHKALKVVKEFPVQVKFKADLKPINYAGGYVIHLLEIIEA